MIVSGGNSGRWHRWALIGGLALLLPASSARAVCPDDLCDCLGQAGHFAVVANGVSAKSGQLSYGSGSVSVFPSTVDTSVCAMTAKLAGKQGGETDISEDLILTAASGVAAKFKGSKYMGSLYPGVFVEGDLGTGGGLIEGAAYGLVTGTTDTLGGNPRVGECQQAFLYAGSASATLAMAAPTQTFGKVKVSDPGLPFEINAGPGVNVIQIEDLTLKPKTYSGSATGTEVDINLDLATSSVIVNITGKLAIGQACVIAVNGGDIEDVIINVVGAGPAVKIKSDASIQPPILAPGRKVVAGIATSANLFANSVKLKGTALSETVLCP